MRTRGTLLVAVVFLWAGEALRPCPAPKKYPQTELRSTFRGKQRFSSGAEVSYDCAEGFAALKGSRSVSCTDGRWSKLTLECRRGCGAPPSVPELNAEPDEKYITKTFFASGDKVYYNCAVGYTPVSGSRTRLCRRGIWMPLTMTCERRLCGSPGEILNGEFTYTGVQFGDTATAACHEGYILVGKATRRCRSEGWDGRIPECEEVVCEAPPEVKNAEMEGVVEPPFTYSTVVSYHCRVGTLIGQKELWCTEDGTWSAPPPVCKEITCPSPNVPYAFWQILERPYEYKDAIWIECNEGYKRIGPSTIMCDKNGRWTPPLPKCHWLRYQRRI